MTTLVLVEHDGQRVKRSSLAGIELARRLGGKYSLALLGTGLGAMASGLQGFGAEAVLVMDDAALAEPIGRDQLRGHRGAPDDAFARSQMWRPDIPRAAHFVRSSIGWSIFNVRLIFSASSRGCSALNRMKGG